MRQNRDTYTMNASLSARPFRAYRPTYAEAARTARDDFAMLVSILLRCEALQQRGMHKLGRASRSVHVHTQTQVQSNERTSTLLTLVGTTRTFAGWVCTRQLIPAVLGSIPYNIALATTCVRSSPDARTYISSSQTRSTNPTLSWYTPQKSWASAQWYHLYIHNLPTLPTNT